MLAENELYAVFTHDCTHRRWYGRPRTVPVPGFAFRVGVSNQGDGGVDGAEAFRAVGARSVPIRTDSAVRVSHYLYLRSAQRG